MNFPLRLWSLTNSDESLFTLSPDDLATFTLLTKEFYATDTQPGTSGSAPADWDFFERHAAVLRAERVSRYRKNFLY